MSAREGSISSHLVVHVLKFNLSLYDGIQLGRCSKSHYHLLLKDPNFWKQWCPSSNSPNQTTFQLQALVKQQYLHKHYFVYFQDMIQEKPDKRENISEFPYELDKLDHLFRRFPGICDEQVWLIDGCLHILESHFGTIEKRDFDDDIPSPFPACALRTLNIFQQSNTICDYHLRIKTIEKATTTRYLRTLCNELLMMIEEKKQTNLKVLFHKILNQMDLTESECSNFIEIFHSVGLQRDNLKMIQAAIVLMQKDILYKEYFGRSKTSQLLDGSLHTRKEVMLRFYEVLASDPNGTRDFGGDMRNPDTFVSLFLWARTMDLSKIEPLVGLICELAGLPRYSFQSKVALLDYEKRFEEGLLLTMCQEIWRFDDSYPIALKKRFEVMLKVQGKQIQRNSEQFKIVKERLNKFLLRISKVPKSNCLPFLYSLHGILLSDNWRTAHTPDEEILFLNSFLKDQEGMRLLSKKYHL
eukprot:TRINITY_DN10562_c0_g1_i4.p1 TRINITY_DN10562_c0_g1~~TRINITY_DN10562_c0_g1_i4.p1  ORF type:complete len:469 (-),score=109.85 TRINITY_DN10562_c0_g1_i4:68-1474(-)